ncbi:hypothetical protein PUNSTDRAFT_127772, partial [Punctularia strigosozonata HHB-11173 SS5]|uniref:uncharacterized protein n=1 Tax=Punctularia strigosozonata (strain HHB-11173) TaxID=741275 RepID=UPI0004416D47
MSSLRLSATTVRKQSSADNALHLARTTAAITRELGDLCQFPPVSAAATLLLVVFDTIQSLQKNKTACVRLARRAASILLDIRDQMRGRWEDAPPSLKRNIRKFEDVLVGIADFMKNESTGKWHQRVMRRASTEDAISDFGQQLDDAARSFQIAALIDIHYSIGERTTKMITYGEETSSPIEVSTGSSIFSETTRVVLYDESEEGTSSRIKIQKSAKTISASPTSTVFSDSHAVSRSASVYDKSNQTISSPYTELPDSPVSRARTISVSRSFSGDSTITSSRASSSFVEVTSAGSLTSIEETEVEERTETTPLIDDDRGFVRYHQSEITLGTRKSRIKKGWWAGATEIQVSGRQALIKRYDASASNVKETTLYVQQQFQMSEEHVIDFVEKSNYRVDPNHAVVMGLPPPREGGTTWRNYDLTHALLRACTQEAISKLDLKMLPFRSQPTRLVDTSDKTLSHAMQVKLSHLVYLAEELLPGNGQRPGLPGPVAELLDAGDEDEDEEEEAPTISLRQLRDLNIRAGRHNHCWRQLVEPFEFLPGDIGYIPVGEEFRSSFKKLANVFDDGLVASMGREKSASANRWSWKALQSGRLPVQGFPLPYDITGWPIAVPPQEEIQMHVIHEEAVSSVNSAWKFLMDHASKIARQHSIPPEELIFITRAGTDQDFSINHFAPPMFGGFHQPSLHQPHHFG